MDLSRAGGEQIRESRHPHIRTHMMTMGATKSEEGPGVCSRAGVRARAARLAGRRTAALATALAIHGLAAAAVVSAGGNWSRPTDSPPAAVAMAVDLVEQAPTGMAAADDGRSSFFRGGTFAPGAADAPARMPAGLPSGWIAGRATPLNPARSRPPSGRVNRSKVAQPETSARDQSGTTAISGVALGAVAVGETTGAASTGQGIKLAPGEGLATPTGPGGGQAAVGRGDVTGAGQPSRTASAAARGGAGRGRPAQVIHAVNSESVYPPSPLALGIEGTVAALLDIDQQGAVTAVTITGPAGHGFDEAAREALKQFRFNPALGPDGRPVRCRLAWKYDFVVKD